MVRDASAARVYASLAGGSKTFAADRLAANAVTDAWAGVRNAVAAHRAFLARALAGCAAAGIYQYLDLGSGLSGDGSVYATVRELLPAARVVAVDHDEAVVRDNRLAFYGRGATRAGDQRARAVLANVIEAAAVIKHPDVRRLIDFTRPVVVVMGALLHFIPDDQDPYAMVAVYRKVMAPYSRLILSHATGDGADDAVFAAREIYQKHVTDVVLRSHGEVSRFFDSLRLLPPGVVDAPDWHSGGGPRERPSHVWAGVGLVPTRRHPSVC